MTPKVVKTTSKGQITLPKKWRDQFDTDNFILQIETTQIVIKPIQIESEEVIFDADRDNEGEGITPDEMIQMLKNVKNG